MGSLSTDTDIVDRSARQKRVFDEMHACYRARKLGEPQVEWVYPVYDIPKAALAAALPRELLDLTWSCRTPVDGFKPCLTCKACRTRQGLRTPVRAAENQG